MGDRDISKGIDPSKRFLSAGHDTKSIDETLSNLLGNSSVSGKKRFCVECGTEIHGEAYVNPSSPSDTYCKQHSLSFAEKCEGCMRPLQGAIVTVDGKKYHQTCKSIDVQCKGCNQMITYDCLSACGNNWHTSCFKCHVCHKLLNENISFVNRAGFPYCQSCNQSNPPKQVVRETTQTQQKTSAPAQQEQLKQKIFCGECGKPIAGESITLGSVTMHSTCFTCSKCSKPLANTPFSQKGEQYFCANCAGPTNSAGSCAGCHQGLSGKFVQAMNAKWHKECFVCASCKGGLGGGFAEHSGKAYCPNCIEKVSKPTTTTVIDRKLQGFTIDPRTGQKKYT